MTCIKVHIGRYVCMYVHCWELFVKVMLTDVTSYPYDAHVVVVVYALYMQCVLRTSPHRTTTRMLRSKNSKFLIVRPSPLPCWKRMKVVMLHLIWRSSHDTVRIERRA